MRNLVIALLVLGSVQLNAQQAEPLTFSESSYSFGSIKEEGGPVLHEFTFTNTSTEPVQITNVKASCGCTTPDWTRELVQPGAKGFIQAQYNPRNRPGKFNKSLTVNHNLGAPVRLYINGDVVPRPRSLAESYPKEMGSLRMKTSTLNVGRVYVNREPMSRKFEIVNQSDSSVSFQDKIIAPDYIKLTFESDTLLPKATTNVVVSYDGAVKEDLGFMNDKISFFVNEGSVESEKELTIYATLEEYFAPMTKEKLAEAPRLTLDNTIYDLGRIKLDEKVETEVEIKNDGKSDLLIKKIYPNCTCLLGEMRKNKIKSGASSLLKITFDASGRRGNQQKSITLYSNDPTGPTQRITVKAYIEE